jgi:hypothetical protein
MVEENVDCDVDRVFVFVLVPEVDTSVDEVKDDLLDNSRVDPDDTVTDESNSTELIDERRLGDVICTLVDGVRDGTTNAIRGNVSLAVVILGELEGILDTLPAVDPDEEPGVGSDTVPDGTETEGLTVGVTERGTLEVEDNGGTEEDVDSDAVLDEVTTTITVEMVDELEITEIETVGDDTDIEGVTLVDTEGVELLLIRVEVDEESVNTGVVEVKLVDTVLDEEEELLLELELLDVTVTLQLGMDA